MDKEMKKRLELWSEAITEVIVEAGSKEEIAALLKAEAFNIYEKAIYDDKVFHINFKHTKEKEFKLH